MLKSSKRSLLGGILCVCSAAAWAGPIVIPVPGASTAPPPQASASPAAVTGSAPAATTAPVATTTTKPASAATPPANPPPPGPPKPKVDYSYADVSALLVQPFGAANVGHGEKLTVSDALSPRAFLILDGARFDSRGEVRHSFDLGLGLNTRDGTGRSFYATFTWTGIGFQTQGTPSSSGHGVAVAGGLRAQPLESVELDAEIRYDNNPVVDGHTSGEIGMLYRLHPRLWLGLTLGTNALENDYLLTLRWTF